MFLVIIYMGVEQYISRYGGTYICSLRSQECVSILYVDFEDAIVVDSVEISRCRDHRFGSDSNWVASVLAGKLRMQVYNLSVCGVGIVGRIVTPWMRRKDLSISSFSSFKTLRFILFF
ncbi:hypothetical protein P167DRAFT_60246 [Morchella conica CCBAS932]|uniref:Uncharacterized protein n=1 Tax=Morchella conica CCBAS932 TaxID=1392247 RepID=A0A3N4KVV2_9PEZI|nr:hypothetical protein P167DRAFT_60246 [Morchella conica CCBAS932]